MADNRFTNKVRAIKRMQALPLEIVGEVRVQMAANRTMLEEAIRRAAPIDDGSLKKSVTSKDISDETALKFQVSAGDEDAFYARMVEFGTPLQRAEPFFYPTYRALKKLMIGRIARAAGKGARRAVNSR